MILYPIFLSSQSRIPTFIKNSANQYKLLELSKGGVDFGKKRTQGMEMLAGVEESGISLPLEKGVPCTRFNLHSLSMHILDSKILALSIFHKHSSHKY